MVSLSVAMLYTLPIVGYPAISILPTIIGVDSRIVTIPFRAAVMGFSLFMLGIGILGVVKMYKGWLWLPAIILWLAYMFRLINESPVAPLWESLSFVLGVVGIPMLALAIYPSRRTLWWAQLLIMLVSTIPCFFASRFGGLEEWTGTFGRAQFYALNNMNLARVASAGAIASMSIVLFPSRPNPSLLIRILAWVVFFFTCYVTIGTASRGPLVSLILVLFLMAWLAFRRKGSFKMLLFTLVLMICGLGYAFTKMEGRSFHEKMSGLVVVQRFESHELTDQWRVSAFIRAFHQFLDSPVIGSSIFLEDDMQGVMCHSMYLECLTATGIIGGIPMLLIVIASLRSCWIIIRDHPSALWVTMIFFLFFIGSIFSSTVFSNQQVYGYFFAVIAIAHSPQLLSCNAKHPNLPFSVNSNDFRFNPIRRAAT